MSTRGAIIKGDTDGVGECSDEGAMDLDVISGPTWVARSHGPKARRGSSAPSVEVVLDVHVPQYVLKNHNDSKIRTIVHSGIESRW